MMVMTLQELPNRERAHAETWLGEWYFAFLSVASGYVESMACGRIFFHLGVKG